MSKIIGIDLGTTNCCVSVLEAGIPKIIVNAEGARTTPSVVAYRDGERLIGESAKRQAVTNPETIFSIKSKMGYGTKVKLDGKEFTPEEISAMLLQTLKVQAEAYLGEEVNRAVITVPAYFNDAQRQATKDAGRIAGFKVERIINEPTAAALAYGMDKAEIQQTILVFDFGGGTFDVSILELDTGLFQVKATSGDNRLGGDDFDQVVTEYLIHDFYTKTGVDLVDDVMACSRIRESAEKAKKELSFTTVTQVTLPFITTKDSEPLHLESTITREKFNQLTKNLVDCTIEPMKRALRDSGLEPYELDKVILIGGTTRIPAVVDMVKEITGKEPYKAINPDEAVAMGAAVQGGVLTGEVEDLILVDVTPLSLGIKIAGGLFTKVIERNTSIPVSQSQIFSTASDNQHSVNIHVLQGERAMAADNKTLGHFYLKDIAPAPSGVPQIEVTFSIDKNGIVSVSAKDLRTARSQTVVIQAESGLTEEDIAKMVKDAETNARLDEEKASKAILINTIRQTITQVKQVVKELGDSLTEEEVEDALSKCTELDLGIKEDSYETLKIKLGKLKDVMSLLLIKTYQEETNSEHQD